MWPPGQFAHLCYSICGKHALLDNVYIVNMLVNNNIRNYCNSVLISL